MVFLVTQIQIQIIQVVLVPKGVFKTQIDKMSLQVRVNVWYGCLVNPYNLLRARCCQVSDIYFNLSTI